MPGEAVRTRRPVSQPARPVSDSRPAPGGQAEFFAFDRALAQLSEAASGMIAACQSCLSGSTADHGERLSPAEVPAAAAALLAQGASTMHAVTGRPDLLGLLAPGPLLLALAGSPVQARILCPEVLRTNLGGQRLLRDLAGSGAQIATSPVLPPQLIVLDGQAAVVTAAGSGGDVPAGATIVRDPRVAGYLAAAVDAFWAVATPAPDAVVRDDDGLSPADRALLRLLAEGMTQQEAARRLHLSLRTVSRRTAVLKHELKAASPMQAGLEAARRGWL